MFHTSTDTLAHASVYFRAMLSERRRDEEEGTSTSEAHFLDRDPDAFRCLLPQERLRRSRSLRYWQVQLLEVQLAEAEATLRGVAAEASELAEARVREREAEAKVAAVAADELGRARMHEAALLHAAAKERRALLAASQAHAAAAERRMAQRRAEGASAVAAARVRTLDETAARMAAEAIGAALGEVAEEAAAAVHAAAAQQQE